MTKFKMSEDQRTLWVGNLHEDVTDEIIYELFLQTGPIEKLIFPTEGEGEEKKHKGIAYILFKHVDSVKFSIAVLEGAKLFDKDLEMKARSMPVTYRSTPQHSNRTSRFSDNSSLRGGFNRNNTWHGKDQSGRGSGNFRHKGPNNFNNYNNFNNQMNTWSGQQQGSTQQTGTEDAEAKRQRMLQQQNMMIQGSNYNQQQQGMMMYNQGNQQTWNYSNTTATNYPASTGTWTAPNMMYQQQYGQQQQYGTWYQPQ